LVHRIDKNTSGLLLIAKTNKAMSHLAKQFYEHTIKRQYIALVWGDVKDDKGTIIAHVGRHQRQRRPDGAAYLFGGLAIDGIGDGVGQFDLQHRWRRDLHLDAGEQRDAGRAQRADQQQHAERHRRRRHSAEQPGRDVRHAEPDHHDHTRTIHNVPSLLCICTSQTVEQKTLQ